MLAVTTSDSGIKVLANSDGQRMLRMLESRAFDGARGLSEVNVKVIFSAFLLLDFLIVCLLYFGFNLSYGTFFCSLLLLVHWVPLLVILLLYPPYLSAVTEFSSQCPFW